MFDVFVFVMVFVIWHIFVAFKYFNAVCIQRRARRISRKNQRSKHPEGSQEGGTRHRSLSSSQTLVKLAGTQFKNTNPKILAVVTLQAFTGGKSFYLGKISLAKFTSGFIFPRLKGHTGDIGLWEV